MEKTYVFLQLSGLFAPITNVQNLIDLTHRTVGEDGTTRFESNGLVAEDSRVSYTGPYGEPMVLWKVATSGEEGDGGWISSSIAIEQQKTYRFRVLTKKMNSDAGDTYFGDGDVLSLNDNAHTNPYFWYGQPAVLNRRYLLVEFTRGSGYNSTVSYGAVYDGTIGQKVRHGTNSKFAAGAAKTLRRSYLYYNSNTSGVQNFDNLLVEAASCVKPVMPPCSISPMSKGERLSLREAGRGDAVFD